MRRCPDADCGIPQIARPRDRALCYRSLTLPAARPSQNANPAWERIRTRLRAELGDNIFSSWLAPLTFDRIENGRVELSAPTPFVRDWVASHYAHRIRELWALEQEGVTTVDIAVGTNAPAARRSGSAPARARGGRGLAVGPSSDAERSGEVANAGSPLNGRLTFREFVVGKPNEFAYAAALRVAEADRPPFNPLYIYSGVGLGKTHLIHAIAWRVQESNPNRHVLYLSAEKFMYHFVRAVRYKDTMAFKNYFRSVDVLMIDDVQFICGKDSTQEEFFHTFNALVDHNRQVVIAGDRPPSDLDGMEERLRSRLGWGLVADIHPTTYELRLGILQSKAEALGLAGAPRSVFEYLARRITSNVRELEMALLRVAHHATYLNAPVTLEMTQEVMRDVLRSSTRRVTIEEIQRRVAEHHNIKYSEMMSNRRARAVARPRQMAMYLAKQLTGRSLPEIGRKFGGRDHTTVMHAVRRIEDLMAKDVAIEEDVKLLRRRIEEGDG